MKRYLETNENVNTTAQNSVGHRESHPGRKIHSIPGLSQKTSTKGSNKQSNFTLRGTWKRTTNKAQSE